MGSFISSDSQVLEQEAQTMIADLEPKASAVVASSTRKGATMSEEEQDPSFRFMDLPPEVRNRIYSFAFAAEVNGSALSNQPLWDNLCDCQCRDISSFSLHPFTRVSKELRKESVPVFFDDSVFVAYVESNFQSRGRARRGGPNSFYEARCRRTSGIMRIKRHLKKTLRTFEFAASMRDITFKVHEAGTWGTNAYRGNLVIVYIRIQFHGKAGVDVESWDGPGMKRKHYGYEKEDINVVVKEVQDAAASMGKRPDFKGFTINDVEQLAKVFRFERG